MYHLQTVDVVISTLVVPNSVQTVVLVSSFPGFCGKSCENLFIPKKSIFRKTLQILVIRTYLMCAKNIEIDFDPLWTKIRWFENFES